MKACPKCNGRGTVGYYHIDHFVDVECDRCNGSGEVSEVEMTNEIKIKCDDCKFVENCVDYGWQECKKFTPKPSEPMTNEGWLKSMNTEQLAEFLLEFRFDNNVHNQLCNYLKCNFNGTQKLETLVVEWLKRKRGGES